MMKKRAVFLFPKVEMGYFLEAQRRWWEFLHLLACFAAIRRAFRL
jgi:hypothetical protein